MRSPFALLIGVFCLLWLGIASCNHDWDREWKGPDDASPPDVGMVEAGYLGIGKYARLSAGTFTMDTSKAVDPCANESRTQHVVSLSRCFDIMLTEVSRGEYQALVGHDPEQDIDGTACDESACPARGVNWHQAANYCNLLTPSASERCYACSGDHANLRCDPIKKYEADVRECPGFRLPTEAEWEYAYRAGTTTPLYSGELQHCAAPDPTAHLIAWYEHNADGRPHRRATRHPNPWGIFDMAGNVYEWCHDSYEGAAATPAVNPIGSLDALWAIQRGGAFNTQPETLRGAARLSSSRGGQANNVGVRCIRSAPSALELVINELFFPGGDNGDFKVDLDGSGPKNQLGLVLKVVGPLIDLHGEIKTQFDEGLQIGLIEVYADSLDNETNARVQFHRGRDNDVPANPDNNFSGDGVFRPAETSLFDSVLPATASGGQIAAGPGTVTIPIPFLGESVPLHLARMMLKPAANKSYEGVLAGAITVDDVENNLLKDIALALTDAMNEEIRPLDTNNNDIVEVDELMRSSWYQLLRPDIDSDGDGTNDAYSVGIGISAVTCKIWHIFP